MSHSPNPLSWPAYRENSPYPAMDLAEISEAILAISKTLLHQSAKGVSEAERSSDNASNLHASILAVSQAAECWRSDHPNAQVRTRTERLSRAIRDTAAGVVRQTPLLIPDSLPVSLPSQIGRAFDENLHSDFLACLLSSARTGSFATVLLDTLLSRLQFDPVAKSAMIQFAHREVRLDELDHRLERKEVGSRRIDILVRSESRIVAIENKVFTGESFHQTHDYAAAIRARYPDDPRVHLVFLSPTGRRPLDPSFRALSYRALYEALHDASSQCPPSQSFTHVFDSYVNCLAADFLLSEERALRASLADLQQYGYEF